MIYSHESREGGTPLGRVWNNLTELPCVHQKPLPIWTEPGKDNSLLRPLPNLLLKALSARKEEGDQPRHFLVNHGAQGTRGEARAPLCGPMEGHLLPTHWNQEARRRHQDWACSNLQGCPILRPPILTAFALPWGLTFETSRPKKQERKGRSTSGAVELS